MTPARRMWLGLCLQASLWAFGLYLGFASDALPGASLVARIGLATLFVAVGILLGEVARIQSEFRTLLGAIQAGAVSSVVRDDRQAIDILVAALDSDDPKRRETAHKNLRRLTRQEFPASSGPWKQWWAQARAGFPPQGPGST